MLIKDITNRIEFQFPDYPPPKKKNESTSCMSYQNNYYLSLNITN